MRFNKQGESRIIVRQSSSISDLASRGELIRVSLLFFLDQKRQSPTVWESLHFHLPSLAQLSGSAVHDDSSSCKLVLRKVPQFVTLARSSLFSLFVLSRAPLFFFLFSLKEWESRGSRVRQLMDRLVTERVFGAAGFCTGRRPRVSWNARVALGDKESCFCVSFVNEVRENTE